jgi:hypothetical protein
MKEQELRDFSFSMIVCKVLDLLFFYNFLTHLHKQQIIGLFIFLEKILLLFAPRTFKPDTVINQSRGLLNKCDLFKFFASTSG